MAMTREEMLENIAGEGVQACSDYHDGLNGWFGWSIEESGGEKTLRISFTSYESNETSVHEWVLIPLIRDQFTSTARKA